MQQPDTQHLPPVSQARGHPVSPPSRLSQFLGDSKLKMEPFCSEPRCSLSGSGWGRAMLPNLPCPCRDAPTKTSPGSIWPEEERRFPLPVAAAAEQRCSASS